MSEVTEGAKAVQETAKFGTKLFEAGQQAGEYVGWVLGTVPADLVGVLGGDWLQEVRIRNMARLKARTKEILTARGATETVAVSPSLAVPLLRAAMDESRDELQELWARLIANAMDPRSQTVRLSFIETVKQMDPLDAVILQRCNRGPVARQTDWIVIQSLSQVLSISSDAVMVSLIHLHKLGCIGRIANKHEHGSPSMEQAELLKLSAYGRELLRACEP